MKAERRREGRRIRRIQQKWAGLSEVERATEAIKLMTEAFESFAQALLKWRKS